MSAKVERQWKNKRRLKQSLTAAALIFLLTFSFLLVMNPGNIAETRPNHPDPGLRTRRYRQSLQQTSDAVVAMIPTLKTYGRRWRRVVKNKPLERNEPLGGAGEQEEIVEQAEVPVLLFTDDLVVIMRVDAREVTVDVRSASRVGRGDFGENRRHILQLLRALDEQLAE